MCRSLRSLPRSLSALQPRSQSCVQTSRSSTHTDQKPLTVLDITKPHTLPVDHAGRLSRHPTKDILRRTELENDALSYPAIYGVAIVDIHIDGRKKTSWRLIAAICAHIQSTCSMFVLGFHLLVYAYQHQTGMRLFRIRR
jgi:hypothetical protein